MFTENTTEFTSRDGYPHSLVEKRTLLSNTLSFFSVLVRGRPERVADSGYAMHSASSLMRDRRSCPALDTTGDTVIWGGEGTQIILHS